MKIYISSVPKRTRGRTWKNYEGSEKTAEDVRKDITLETRPYHRAPAFVSPWTQPTTVPDKRQFCKEVRNQGGWMVTRRQVEAIRSSVHAGRHAAKGSLHLVLRTKRLSCGVWVKMTLRIAGGSTCSIGYQPESQLRSWDLWGLNRVLDCTVALLHGGFGKCRSLSVQTSVMRTLHLPSSHVKTWLHISVHWEQ